MNRNELGRRDVEQSLRTLALEPPRRNPQLAHVQMRHHVRQATAVIRVHMREHDGIELTHSTIEQRRRDVRIALPTVDEDGVIRCANED